MEAGCNGAETVSARPVPLDLGGMSHGHKFGALSSFACVAATVSACLNLPATVGLVDERCRSRTREVPRLHPTTPWHQLIPPPLHSSSTKTLQAKRRVRAWTNHDCIRAFVLFALGSQVYACDCSPEASRMVRTRSHHEDSHDMHPLEARDDALLLARTAVITGGIRPKRKQKKKKMTQGYNERQSMTALR